MITQVFYEINNEFLQENLVKLLVLTRKTATYKPFYTALQLFENLHFTKNQAVNQVKANFKPAYRS